MLTWKALIVTHIIKPDVDSTVDRIDILGNLAEGWMTTPDQAALGIRDHYVEMRTADGPTLLAPPGAVLAYRPPRRPGVLPYVQTVGDERYCNNLLSLPQNPALWACTRLDASGLAMLASGRRQNSLVTNPLLHLAMLSRLRK